MKIGALNPQISTQLVGLEKKHCPSGKSETAAEGAKVTLTSKLVETDNADSFDAGKVADIAQAIREGRFKIDAEAIADKLISNARELMERRSS